MDRNHREQWKHFKALISTHDLPELGPTPRASRFPLTELKQKLDRLFAEAAWPADLKLPLQSAAFLWHDYLDESHTISQELHGADGSFLHGIMHRREPDYGNAKYWFRRVGSHPCFPNIAVNVERLLETKGEQEWLPRLVPGRRWDPFAFIDACEAANEKEPRGNRQSILRSIQEIEFDALLAHLFRQLES